MLFWPQQFPQRGPLEKCGHTELVFERQTLYLMNLTSVVDIKTKRDCGSLC